MRTSNSLLLNIFAAVFVLFASAAFADNAANWGPEVGTTLPDMTVTTHDGMLLTLNELRGKNGFAIAFVRSADWCPFCKRQIIEINKSKADFDERGVNLVALSYDSEDILKAFADKQGIEYTLVSDEGSAVIDAFGIRNMEHEKGSSGYGIPHPGIMLFDSSGKLYAKFAEEGYRTRPPIEGVLDSIDAHHAQ